MRYREYCAAFHIESCRSIDPFEFSEGDIHRISHHD